jgi:DNA-binding Lrp family transcriptional regulator
MKRGVRSPLDEVDRKLLQILQDDFPLALNPWQAMARRLGLSRSEVMDRTRRLMNLGIIRRIGGTIDRRKMGFKASTLVLMKPPRGKLEEVAEELTKLESVTHNYQRIHEFPLWVTLVARDESELEKLVAKVRELGRGAEVLSLPTKRIFKVSMKLKVD